ncbi:MAG TPA: endonuclease/exonuclease/phosphatase family protein [Flavobacteriaceae bacterium]|nr:endonuclease/exonuclease/phosphatase family protein [Flavobacteriaceae bacterium]
MRRLGCLGSLIFYANSLVAFLLLLSFVLPYLPPTRFPTVSMLSLGVFPLIILNGIFMLYWLIRLRKQFFLSLIVLILATLNFGFFIKFDNSTSESREKDSIRLLSYNVRLFNYYEAKEKRNEAPEKFETIVREINPDLLFIQAFKEEKEMDFSAYPYKYVDYNDSKKLFGHAIYSKYPIIDQGAFSFEQSNNNALWADVKIAEDTFRIYNVHLQSMRIIAKVAYIQETGTDFIKNKISHAFVKQERQVRLLRKHMEASPHKNIIVAGDFNNTPFSYNYKKLKGDMKDAFLEKGSGIGTTFYFDGFPLRIDYILVSPNVKVKQFHTVKETFSDHQAIWADIDLNTP